MVNATPLKIDPKSKKKMMKRMLIITVSVLFLIAVLGGVYLYRDRLFPKKPSETYRKMKDTKDEPMDYSHWQFYQDPETKYAIRIPPEWMINQKRNKKDEYLGEVTFMPSPKGKSYGSINQITIKTLQKNERDTDYPSSARDFQTWSTASEDLEKNNLVKVDTETVEDKTIIILLNKTKSSVDGYYLTGWLRHNNVNYYVNVEGDKGIDKDDILAFKYLLKTFTVQ